MWDNIPFEIQENILKRLPIRSLLCLRSVSKACKSLIESSAFIADYQHTDHELQQHILVRYDNEHNYVSTDDTFPHHKVSLTAPVSVKLLNEPAIVGCSQGIFCFYENVGKPSDSGKKTAVIWNPTIGKSVAIDVPNVLDGNRYITRLGFGVCPHTLDPMLLNISIERSPGENNTFADTTWRVEIFRLSSGAWKSLSINLPRGTLVTEAVSYPEVIDRFIYWLAFDMISRSNVILSFDMISEEFTEIRLPDDLESVFYPYRWIYLRKFNGSLVVLGEVLELHVREYHVWMMENGDPKSFIKLYTINNNKPDVSISRVFGFRKSGEPLVEVRIEKELDYELSVYDPKSERIDYFGISAKRLSLFVRAYTETLLLLDH